MRRDPRIVSALNLWLAENPETEATVGEMANAVDLSPARFSHLFVMTTGILPREFLRVVKRYRYERDRARAILRALGLTDVLL